MAYFETTVCKSDLEITSTDFDTQVADWGLKSDAEVDDLLYDVATKAWRITALPILPLTTVPEGIKDASNHLVKAKYYQFVKNFELMNFHTKESEKRVTNYINRLKVEKEIYGRIAR